MRRASGGPVPPRVLALGFIEMHPNREVSMAKRVDWYYHRKG